MTKEEFMARGGELSKEAQVADSFHEYFRMHSSRLFHACELFKLFGKLGNVLEIGPFYGYTPFMLRPYSSAYTVLEGDDPAVHRLAPLYQQYSITFSYVDFFELFGPIHSAIHHLQVPDSSYDTVLCWETMEHFNFNPVKFVKEIYRILKPGGRVCITVPNKASFQNIIALLTGRREKTLIDGFYTFEDYESNGKKAFYGFHWREYSPPELYHLFANAGFKIHACGSFVAFQNHGRIGIGRKFARSLSKFSASLLNRYGTNVYLVAVK